jgi:hypothetical protein
MMFTCPVCFYQGLRKPPVEHEICPCCGTQFGYHDAGPGSLALIYERLRNRWIERGTPWHSRVIPAPLFWNPSGQLIASKMSYGLPWSIKNKVSIEAAVSVANKPNPQLRNQKLPRLEVMAA